MDKRTDPTMPSTSINKSTETKPKAFDAKGAVGKQFTETGAIGSMGEKVGGPLASDGMIGKHFTAGGSVGGTIQDMAGGKKDK